MRSNAFLASLLIAPFIASVTPAAAAGLNGTWSGSGYMEPSSGKRERVRCVVNYQRETPKVFAVSATCASSSASARQTGEVLKVRTNVYAGDFHNQQFNIRGRVRVSVSGRSQTVTFSSSDGGGRLTLRKR